MTDHNRKPQEEPSLLIFFGRPTLAQRAALDDAEAAGMRVVIVEEEQETALPRHRIAARGPGRRRGLHKDHRPNGI